MPDSQVVYERIDSTVEHQMEIDQIPGVSLAVTNGSKTIYQQTYGYASLESQTPVATDHLFEFGSIGKSFTCILLLQLADEGLVDLDKPVTDYLPWFEVQSVHSPITLHHLMTHTAGIINGTDFPADSRYEVWALRDTRAINPPGTHFHYSNVGYKTLGLVIEHVTGKPYGNLVRERILDPLGMHDTEPAITHSTRKRLATGYQRFFDDRPWKRGDGHAPATWLETDTADGCIAGTAADLAKYLRMLMNQGVAGSKRVLSPDGLRRMTSVHIGVDRFEDGGYGYGLFSYKEKGRQFLGHSGGMVGYFANMVTDLTSEFGIVTLINGPGQQLPIADYALDALHAATTGAPIPDVPVATDPSTIDEPERFTGTYNGADSTIGIVFRDGRLHLQNDGSGSNMEQYGEDTFLVHDPAYSRFLLRFDRGEDNHARSVSFGDTVWYRNGVPGDLTDIPDEWRAFPGHYRNHNPWLGNFRIVLRFGRLMIIYPAGGEEALTPLGDGSFRIGDERSPEFVRFDVVVDGAEWKANRSGCEYYRFFTP